MSFSADVKAEICQTAPLKKCLAVAEAYGILLYCNTFSPGGIKIITESHSFGERLIVVFNKAFGIRFDSAPGDVPAPGKRTYEIAGGEKLRMIFRAFGYGDDMPLAHHINFAVLEDMACIQAFVRGAFLAGGSVTDPAKRYHLELSTGHYNVSRSMYSMLLDMDFSPKDTTRKGNYVIYFKQSAAIEDFLTTIGAPISAMGIMNAAVEKDMRNIVQRRVNCDTANVEKSVEAAQKQMEAIRYIEKTAGLKSLPKKLHDAALLRIVNPEATLSELAELADPPVSKSCISHRLRKLTEIAKL